MAKKKWFQAAGLVLLCHLTITSCQSLQGTGESQNSSTNLLTSESTSQTEGASSQASSTTADKSSDKKDDKTQTESKDKAIPGVTVPTSDGFILTDQSKILSHTKDGIVVEHDGHSHFIFYADLKNTKFAHLIPTGADLTKPTPVPQVGQQAAPSQQATGKDHHYTFNPADIVAEDALGYTVRHGDHYHYILKSSLPTHPGSNSIAAAAPTLPFTGFAGNGRADQPVPSVQTGRQETKPSSQAIAGIDYPTSDGFLFDGTGIQGWTDLGLLVDHGGHLHMILKSDLARSKWAHLLPNQSTKPADSEKPVQPNQPIVATKPSQPTGSLRPVQPTIPVQTNQSGATTPEDQPSAAEVLETKRQYLASQLGLRPEEITVTKRESEQLFVYPHDNHHHAIAVDKVVIGQPIEDPHADPHAHQAVGRATLKAIGFDEDIIEDILHADAPKLFPAEESDPEKMKAWLATVTSLNIGQRKDPLKRFGLELMPNLETLGAGFTPIEDVTPILKFKKLKNLFLTKTGIKDYAFLKELPALEGLDVSQNNLTSLDFLKDYPRLKTLAVSGNDLSDISALSALPNLEFLNLDYNRLTNLSALSNLNKLKVLSVDHNQLTDLSVLSSKADLQRLFVSHNAGVDLSSLRSANLEELTAEQSGLTNLNFVSNLPSLVSLKVKQNAISDLSGLEKTEQLRTLDVSHNKVTDLRLPTSQSSLDTLNISHNQLKTLEGIQHFTVLATLNAGHNQLSTLRISEPNKTITYLEVNDNQISAEELTPNSQKVPNGIATHFPATTGGDVSNNKTIEENPSTPPQVDPVALKRAYLAAATGLSEDQILLINTPQGPAFMYPHENHHHVVPLSKLDVTKPFDDGHGGHDHGDDHAHDEGDDHGHEETTVSDAPTTSEPSDPAQPAQPSEPETPERPTQPTTPAQLEVPSEPTKPVQPETPEVPTSAEEVSTPVEPPAVADGEAPTVSETTEHTGEVNPDVPSDSNETQPADSEETAVVSPVTQPEVPTIPATPVTGNQETTPELPVAVEVPNQPTEPATSEQPVEPAETTGPAILEQPEAPTEPVVSTPPAAPQIDEVAVKRAYLAAATGLPEDKIVLLNTPAGPSFMYPHGNHDHVVLLSKLDVTKPFDDGHGNQGKNEGADQGHHAHDETSQHDGHHHDNDGSDEEITEPARTQDSEPPTPEVPSETTATGEVEKATETEGSEEANQPATPVQPAQPTATNRPEQPEAPVQKGVAGIDYPTSDGFLFDGTGMAGWTSAGLLVDHGGHTHILPTEAIAKSKWAYLLPKEPAETSTAPVELSEHLAKQRENLAKQFGLNPEDIRVVTADGKVVGFEYPHEDHYDFVPVSDGENPSGLTDEDKRELTAYIRKTYGLLLGTPVTYHEGFVVFAIPHPHQDYDAKRDYYSDVLDPAYDPGHVHPYAVPLSHLSVLKPTGILELDFENELIAAAKRIGVAPSEVKIKDKKYFVLPGKDHDHYLNILTPIAGYEAYMANKLPDIRADFSLGSYSKAEVEAEADRILAAAEEQFGPGTVEFRRVARALEAFKVNLTVATTSTDGYLKALQSFENKHLKGLVEEEAEATAVDPLVATYLDLSERLKGYDERTLKQYALNAEQVINRLKIMVAIKDEAGLERVATHFAAIDRAKQASSDLAPRLAYMDFFLKNLDSDKLPASLRQEVIDKLIELQKISGLYRNPQKFREGLEDTALLKAKVKAALAATSPAPDHANWTPYPRGFDRKEMANTVNAMRDFLIKNKEMTAEEMADGFGKKLDLFPVHPKKPATVVVVPPAQPKPAEEVTKPAEPSQPETTQPSSDSEGDKPVTEQPSDSNQTQPEHGDSENTSDSAETVAQPNQPEESETQPADGTGEATTPVEKPVDSSEEPAPGEGDGVTGDSGEDDFDWSGWKPIFDIPVDGDDSSRDPEGAEETDWPVWKPIFEVPEDTDLPVWKPIVDLPEDGATNPVDVLDQPTPEVGGQPGGTEEGSPTSADTSGEEEVTDPGSSEIGPVTVDSPSQPSEAEASSDQPHVEMEQPGQPAEHEEKLPTPADTSGEEEVTDPGISEVGPVIADAPSQPSEAGASSDQPHVETNQPSQPAEHEEELPTPAAPSSGEEAAEPGTSEDGSISSDENPNSSDQEAATDQPVQPTQPGTDGPEEGAGTGDRTDDDFDWSGWGSILDIPGEDDSIDWGNWFDGVNRDEDAGLPVWRPLFGDSSREDGTGLNP